MTKISLQEYLKFCGFRCCKVHSKSLLLKCPSFIQIYLTLCISATNSVRVEALMFSEKVFPVFRVRLRSTNSDIAGMYDSKIGSHLVDRHLVGTVFN